MLFFILDWSMTDAMNQWMKEWMAEWLIDGLRTGFLFPFCDWMFDVLANGLFIPKGIVKMKWSVVQQAINV